MLMCLSVVYHAIRCQITVILNVLGFELLQNLYFYTMFQAEIRQSFFKKKRRILILFVKMIENVRCRFAVFVVLCNKLKQCMPIVHICKSLFKSNHPQRSDMQPDNALSLYHDQPWVQTQQAACSIMSFLSRDLLYSLYHK